MLSNRDNLGGLGDIIENLRENMRERTLASNTGDSIDSIQSLSEITLSLMYIRKSFMT